MVIEQDEHDFRNQRKKIVYVHVSYLSFRSDRIIIRYHIAEAIFNTDQSYNKCEIFENIKIPKPIGF